MKDTYVTATLQLLNSGSTPDTVFTNLAKVLEARGHSALLPAILKSLLSAYEVAKKTQTPTVIVANAAAAKTKEVAAALATLGAGTTAPEVVVDTTLIGGSQVLFNHKLVDQSYKTQLHNLYKAALNA